MAKYVFYLSGLKGGSPTFEAFELGGDEAPERALKLLGDHPGRAFVAVWKGDRPLSERRSSVAAAISL